MNAGPDTRDSTGENRREVYANPPYAPGVENVSRREPATEPLSGNAAGVVPEVIRYRDRRPTARGVPRLDHLAELLTRLELLIAVVLSAQCTDERVNEVTAELFEKYQTPEDYAAACRGALADDIYGITFHNNKAGYLQSIGETLVEEHDGEVPDTMSELTDLSGVGRKTANVVLQHGHDIVEGIVVDTHVRGSRGGWNSPRKSARKPSSRTCSTWCRRASGNSYAPAHRPRASRVWCALGRLRGVRARGHLSLGEGRQRGRPRQRRGMVAPRRATQLSSSRNAQ